MYKGKGNSTNEIRVSEQARYLGDAPCILSGQDHFFDCEGFFVACLEKSETAPIPKVIFHAVEIVGARYISL